ncbi:MAG: RNase adapter protein RapZ [Bacteroidales bacterium]|nr:RNase adapter protein RapZ [Bacteroidales bacterium]
MPIDYQIKKQLGKLFKNYFGAEPEKINALPHSGSNRRYFRLSTQQFSAIGAYHDNSKENIAFIHFTEHFLQYRINVPEIYAKNINQNIYLIQDLGDIQLLNWLTEIRVNQTFPKEAQVVYKKVIQELVKIQIVAGRTFDYSYCYPYQAFHKESILFDLNYFKQYFVDAQKLKYPNTKLQNDFEHLSNFLLSDIDAYFMYRDFQARNIMLVDNKPYFIDYQGGRKGALQYDLASLLFQAKANIPNEDRNQLVNYYLNIARLFIPIHEEEFMEKFHAYALIRVLQTLGAYGLRGIIEKKQHFIESISYAIKNLEFLIQKNEILEQLNTLKDIIQQIINTTLKTDER